MEDLRHDLDHAQYDELGDSSTSPECSKCCEEQTAIPVAGNPIADLEQGIR